MYTQYKVIIATILLFSILLQSCGNPSRKLAEEEVPKPSVQTNRPKQVKRRKFVKPVHKQGGCSELSSKRSMSAPCCDSTYELSGEALYALPTVLSSAVHGEFYDEPSSAALHTPPKRIHSSRPSRSSSPSTERKRLPQGVLDPGAITLRRASQLSKSRSVFPVASTRPVAPVEGPQPFPQASLPLRQAAVGLQSTSSIVASPQAPIGPFALSSGKKVVFSQVDGQWCARVKEVWGTFSREMLLPVVCKGDLSVALCNLEGKEAIHTQRRLHILETTRVPWVPSCVYVGYLGLQGGMEQEGRQVQEQTNPVDASKMINRVAVSVQGLQFHEAADKEEDTQDLPGNEVPTVWYPPFVARAVPASVLTNLRQDHLQLHEQSTSKASLLAHVSAVHEPVASTLEDAKMPSLPRSTTFSTLAAAQAAVTAYLARWRLETPSGRAAIREQGKGILKGVEALKKKIKRSYRQQVLGFETQDIDPLVWNRVLQAQHATQSELIALRGLRAQLLDACQIHGQELQVAGIRTTTSGAEGGVELYSSDEDIQQLSDQERKNHAAFVAGIGKVLQKRAEGLVKTLLDHPLDTVENYVQLFIAIPGFPDLLGEYIEAFLHEEDEEKRAELLGGLLTEVILQFFPLPKGKATQLNRIKNKLGQAVQKVASRPSNELNKLIKQGKAPKSICRFDTNRVGTHARVAHVYFKDGAVLSKDGVWSHGGKKLTNQEIKFLKAHGWEIPE